MAAISVKRSIVIDRTGWPNQRSLKRIGLALLIQTIQSDQPIPRNSMHGIE